MKAPNSMVRLTRIVETCGRPEPVTLWKNPRLDKGFQSAVAQNRVMTIKQEPGESRKDFGVVGFHKEPNTAYWVFPRPLRAFENKRVIGINYDLLKDAPVRAPSIFPPLARAARPRRKSERGPEPKAKRFRVVTRFTSTVELQQEIVAESRRAAKAKAGALNLSVDFTRGTQTRRVVKVGLLGEASASPAERFRFLPRRQRQE